MAEQEVNRGEVMTRRFALDEEINIISGRHQAELKPLIEEKNLCEQFIKQTMLAAGEQQFKTDEGHMTFFVTKDSVKVTDMGEVIHYMLASAPPPDTIPLEEWDHIIEHIQSHGLWGLLNNAVSKTAAKEIIETTKAAPPGIEYSSYKDLNWRRGKA